MSVWEKIVKVAATIAGAIAGLLGEWTTLLTVLAVCMCLDYLTGCIVAFMGKSTKTEGGGWLSSVGFAGLAKKAFIIVIVLLATLLDRAIGTDAMVFQTAAACYYIANEGLSILENTVLMGVPVPGMLQRALEALRKKGEDGEAKTDDGQGNE